jgi:hypothetical protein
MMIMLTGFFPDLGYQEQYFTNGERQTAYKIAKEWQHKDCVPQLYLKTWNSIRILPLSESKQAA